MTAEQIAQIVQVVVAMTQGETATQVETLKARLVKMRDELNAVIALLGEPAPAAEQEKPVEPPKIEVIPNPITSDTYTIKEPLPIPKSLEPEPVKPPSKWKKFGRILLGAGKIAGSVAVIAGVPGAGLIEYAPDIINAIASPEGTLGVATVAAAGVKVYEDLKKKKE